MSAEQFGITTVYLNPSFLIKSEQLQDLCRLCGCANDQLMPIFSGEGLENNIQNKIQRYLPIIKINECDSLPLNVCYHCASTLISWDKLYEGCKLADISLRKLSGEEVVLDNENNVQFETLDLEENLDCNIIQLSPSSNAVKSEVDNSDLDDAIQEIITDMIETDIDILTDDDEDDVEQNHSDSGGTVIKWLSSGRTVEQTRNRAAAGPSSSLSSAHKTAAATTPVVTNKRGTRNVRRNGGSKVNDYEKNWQCRFCKVSFNSYGNFQRHVKSCKLSPRTDGRRKLSSKLPAANNKEEIIRQLNNNDEKRSLSRDNRRRVFSTNERSNSVRLNDSIENNDIANLTTNSTTQSRKSSNSSSSRMNDYRCDHCEQQFASKSLITRHMRSVHRIITTTVNDDDDDDVDDDVDAARQSSSCSNASSGCSTNTTTSSSRRRKEQDKKADLLEFNNDNDTCLCYYCERKFRSKSRLEKHMILIHIKRDNYFSRYLRGYCCEICDRGYLNTADMFAHRLLQHNLPELPWSKYLRTICLLVYCSECRRYFRKSSVSNHRCEQQTYNNNNNNNSNNNYGGDTDDFDRSDFYRQTDKPYFCDICGIRYTWKCILRLHREHTHSETWSNRFLSVTDPKYVCQKCDRAFNDDQSLRTHNCKAASTDEQYKYCLVKRYNCFVCEKFFPFRKDIYRHVTNVHPEATDRLDREMKSLETFKKKSSATGGNVFPYRCMECAYTTYGRKELLDHLTGTHNIVTETPFYCHLCRRSFRRPQSFTNHMQTTHPPDETEEQRRAMLNKARIMINGEPAYHCDVCNRNVTQQTDFLVHYRAHHVEKRFTCEQCGRQTRSRYYLNRHINIVHLNIREFACDLCGKTFNRKQSQIEHRRIHTGERPYACETCGKTFVAMNSLISHRKFHNDYFPYECSFCGKKFKIRRAMENHERTHTGERPYKCDICPKTFNNSSRYSYHKKVTHSNNRPYRCYICASSFKTMKFLRRHIKLHSVQQYIQIRKRNNPYMFNKLHSADGKLLCPSNRKLKRSKQQQQQQQQQKQQASVVVLDGNNCEQNVDNAGNSNNTDDSASAYFVDTTDNRRQFGVGSNSGGGAITEEIVYSSENIMLEYDPDDDEEKFDDPDEEYTLFPDYHVLSDDQQQCDSFDTIATTDDNAVKLEILDDDYSSYANGVMLIAANNNGEVDDKEKIVCKYDDYNNVQIVQDAMQLMNGNFTYEEVGPDELIEVIEHADEYD